MKRAKPGVSNTPAGTTRKNKRYKLMIPGYKQFYFVRGLDLGLGRLGIAVDPHIKSGVANTPHGTMPEISWYKRKTPWYKLHIYTRGIRPGAWTTGGRGRRRGGS